MIADSVLMAKNCKAQAIAHWLMILKPGQCMEFIPADFGVKAVTIQEYVWSITATGNRRYKIINGERRRSSRRVDRDNSQPVGVRYLGEKA